MGNLTMSGGILGGGATWLAVFVVLCACVSVSVADASDVIQLSPEEIHGLGEDVEQLNSCMESCTAGCAGVMISLNSHSCKKMLGESAKALQMDAAGVSKTSCMQQCRGRGAVCSGVYLSRGSNECHMILSKPGGSVPAPGVGVSGSQKSPLVSIHFGNDPNPANKNSKFKPVTTGKAAKAVKKAVKKEAKKAVKKAAKKAAKGKGKKSPTGKGKKGK